MKLICILGYILAIGLVNCDDPEVPEAEWELLPGGGLKANVPSIEGMSMVSLHFNINEPLPGVSAGKYNIDINTPNGDGTWGFENAEIEVKEGDVVYYWILVLINGAGYQKLELSFELHEKSPSTTTTSTTTPATTTTTVETTTTTTEPTTTTTAIQVPEPQFELLEKGLKIFLEDPEGKVMYFAFHMNINEPLEGVDFGDYNYVVTESDTDGNWMIIEPSVTLNDSDIVHYWYYLAYDGEGYELTGLMWSNGGPITTTTPGTTTPPIPDIISVTETSEGGYYEPGQLVFEDNFDTLNSFIWEHEKTMAGGGNWEFQMYTHNRSNSYTRDGILYLKPTITADIYGEDFIKTKELDMWGGQPGDLCTMNSFYGCKRLGGADGTIINPIMSARLRTAKSFTFKYGKVEARAKMPLGDWLWPAIWMLPKDHAYGQWPASGEIDIVECKGNPELTLDGQNIGTKMAGHTLHFGGGYPENGWPNAHFEKIINEGFNADFHKFQVNWTPDYIEFGVDDEVVGKIEPPSGGFWELGEWHETDMESPWRFADNPKMAPFDQHFFLVINLAVGGTEYFPDEASNPGGKPWNNKSPTASADFWNGKGQWLPTWNLDQNNGEDAALAIDYIKIWASDVVREQK